MHVIATLHSPHSNTSKHKEHLLVEKKIDYYQLNIEHISTLFTSISVFHFTNKSDALVRVEVLRPSQPNGVMSSAVSFTLPHVYWAGLVL